MSKYVLICFAFFALAGCKWLDAKKELAGSWLFHEVRVDWQRLGTVNAIDIPNAELKNMNTHDGIYSFFPTGDYTHIDTKGSYREGKWQVRIIKGRECLVVGALILTLSMRHELDKEPKGLRLSLTLPTLNTEQVYAKAAAKDAQIFENPFLPAYNTWRVPPKKPENAAEVHERLGNYIKYMRLFFKLAKGQQNAKKYLPYLMGIVKAEADKVMVVETITPEWRRCFYSADDAQNAYYMLKGLHNNFYKNTDNLILDGYNFFTKIESEFKNMKQ